MKLKEMTIEQLKAYRASVEAYGTASELYYAYIQKGSGFMLSNIKCSNWWKAALVRMARTMAQTAIALIGTATLISDINWVAVGSATLLAGVLSVLTSISGLPECSREVIEAKADLRDNDLEV